MVKKGKIIQPIRIEECLTSDWREESQREKKKEREEKVGKIIQPIRRGVSLDNCSSE